MANPQANPLPSPPSSAREAAPASSTASRRALTPSVLALRLVPQAAPADPQPVLHLAADLICAAGGTLQSTHDRGLFAAFPNLPLAVLIARRLQWALEGLTAAGNHPAAALAISAASESLDPPPPAAGDILLSPAASAAVSDLPGFDFHDASAGWRRFLWQPSTTPVSPEADESAVLRLIHDAGRPDPCPASSPTPAPPRPKPVPVPSLKPAPQATPKPAPLPASAPAHLAAAPAHQAEPAPAPRLSARADAPSPAFESTSFFDKLGPAPRRYFILGGIVAALLLIVFAVLFSTRHTTPSTTSTSSAPAPVTPAALPTAAPLPTAPPNATPAHRKPSPATKTAVAEKAPAAEPKPKPFASDAGACDFSEAGVQHALARAETDMHNGNLEDAKAAFLKLRACASARDRAEQDLRKVQLMIDTHP